MPPEISEGPPSRVKQGSLEGLEEVEVVTVTEGGQAVLECHLRKGSPAPNRTWTLNPDVPLPRHFKVSKTRHQEHHLFLHGKLP